MDKLPLIGMFYWVISVFRLNKSNFWFVLLGWIGCLTTSAQSPPFVKINGYIYEFNTQNGISAKGIWKDESGKKILFQADSKGFFEAELPCQKGQLNIEMSGYRTLTIPAHLTQSNTKVTFATSFHLLPNDKQNSNKPYQQSEQRHFTLKDTSLSQKAYKSFHFQLIDAISKETIRKAAVCFSYTQTKKTECVDTDKQTNKIKVVFNQKDIIAFQAKATGYQDYNGNLIIDNLNNQTDDYPLYLLREVTLLSVMVESKQAIKGCWLVAANGQKKALLNLSSNHYMAQLIPNQNYTLITETLSKQYAQQTITIQPGINVATVAFDNPTKLPESNPSKPPTELISPLPLVVPNKEYTVYFEQSDFQLLADSKALLQSVGQTLKQQPEKILYIEGHTDNVGNQALNQALSEYRAKAVSTFLFNLGIKDEQFILSGYGGTRPQVANDTEENRKKNRRVILRFADKNTNILTTK